MNNEATKELAALNEFDSDVSWFNDNFEELRKKYKGKYIAVKNKKVILVQTNLDELYKNAEEKSLTIENSFICVLPTSDAIQLF